LRVSAYLGGTIGGGANPPAGTHIEAVASAPLFVPAPLRPLSANRQGAGLGLSPSRNLVEMRTGRILGGE